ncbi:MAG: GNAT family N-acetyltransferase [Myxococcota bacterium]
MALATVRRIEAADADGALASVRALAALRPGQGVVAERLAGGLVAYGGPGSPINRGRAFGMDGPVAAVELDAVVAFYRSRGLTAHLEVAPFADPSLVDGLAARGFAFAGFVHVLTLAGDGAVASPAAGRRWPSGAWRRATRADAWARLVGQGFGEDAPSATTMDLGRVVFELPEAACFQADLGGVPAGGGALRVADGVGWLFAGSTRPDQRGRGVQSALIAARVAHARAAGCDIVAVATRAGSASQRNLERAGFRVAYTRAALELPYRAGDGDAPASVAGA